MGAVGLHICALTSVLARLFTRPSLFRTAEPAPAKTLLADASPL